jgi:thiamine biosynthesis lipoprotein
MSFTPPRWLAHTTNPAGLPGWQTFTGIGMDTFITIALQTSKGDAVTAVQRAFDWFQVVERTCSRFNPASELSRLTVGERVPVSPLLFELLNFSVQLAKLTGGAFDPAVGAELEAAGFRREYLSGEDVRRAAPAESGSYRDVRLDPVSRTVTLRRRVLLDVGAVAKGLAIDLATVELGEFPAGSVEAGGDLRVWGESPSGGLWSLGIQHPDLPDRTIRTIRVAAGAVCTSGGYERPSETGAGHHLVVKGAAAADQPKSVTVVAPTALAADGLSTAAFLLGARRGLKLAREQGVGAIIVQSNLSILTTPNLTEYTVE